MLDRIQKDYGYFDFLFDEIGGKAKDFQNIVKSLIYNKLTDNVSINQIPHIYPEETFQYFDLNETPSELIPVIAARSNSAGDIIKTDEGDCFRGEYIPREYHRILGRIYDLRTIIERKNSNEVVGYNRSEMPTRGINWARLSIIILF